jgi:L-ascorbate metabolism protein UlaG (beta-lactamase superfamily)
VYFAGDTRLIPELYELRERFPGLDLALLPVNGLQIRPAFNRKDVMDSREAAELLGRLRPAAAVPIHYTFTGGPLIDRVLLRYTGTVEEFTRLAAELAPATAVHVLAPGQSLRLGATAA